MAGMLLGPIGAALAKEVVKPELRGNFHDFAVKFPLYLQQLSAGQVLSDELRLTLLESSLDKAAQVELQRRREHGGATFPEFWNWLAQKYGGDTQSALREELRTLRPEHDGKLNLQAWREFEAKFRLVYGRLEYPNEDEACSLILQRLPEHQRRAIIREQVKRSDGQPQVKVSGAGGIGEVNSLIATVIPPLRHLHWRPAPPV